jgi:hypothetical protein
VSLAALSKLFSTFAANALMLNMVPVLMCSTREAGAAEDNVHYNYMRGWLQITRFPCFVTRPGCVQT